MVKMGKKVLFFDADGTMIKGNVISPQVRAALKALEQSDVLSVLSTGRSLPSIQVTALKDVDLTNAITAAGGCVIINHQIVSHDYLTKEHLIEITSYLDHYGLYYTFECNESLYIYKGTLEHHLRRFDHDESDPKVHASFERRKQNFLNQIKEIDDPLSLHVNKIHWFENPQMYDQGVTPLTYAQIKEVFGDRFNVNPLSFMPGNGGGEINEKGITKKKGMDLIVDHYHIAPDDVYAIGDGYNDLQMLENASHAIAMGNAPQAIKDICEYVSDDYDHDGFVTALKHYHLI